VPTVERLALPQGPHAPGRASGANILASPRKQARSVVDGLQPAAQPAARPAGDARKALQPDAILLAALQRQFAAEADRDRPLDLEAHAARLGEVPVREHGPLPARRDEIGRASWRERVGGGG